MTQQLEMWKINDYDRLIMAIRTLEKLKKVQGGLFKKVKEIEAEILSVSSVVKDINLNQIYE